MRTLFVFVNLLCACTAFSQELIPYRDSKLWGYADASGKIIIAPQYEKAFPVWKNGICKVMKNGEYFLIDAKNQVKTKQGYKQIWEFSNGFAAACKGGKIDVMQGEIVGGKWGYLRESDFSEAIPFEYDRAFDFNGKLAIVQTGGNWGNWGVIDNSNTVIIPFRHPTYSFDMRPHPSIRFYKGGKQLQIDISGSGNSWIITDLTGKKIAGPVNSMHGLYENPNEKNITAMDAAEKTREAKIARENYVLKTNKGTYYTSGDLTCIEKGIYIADIKDENKKTFFGLIDENNNVLVPFIYDYIYHIISEGFVKVSRNNFYGFCDLKGNEVVQCRYADVEPFEKGIAKVFLSRNDYSDNSVGYINAKGYEYFKSEPVYQVVTLDGKTQITDQYFNPVKLPEDNISTAKIYKNNFIVTVLDFQKVKLYDVQGNLLETGTNVEELSDDCLLVHGENVKRVYSLVSKKVTVDSIHHISTRLFDPKTLRLVGYAYSKPNSPITYGCFDLTGRVILKPAYASIVFSGMYYVLNSGHEYGICDTNGHFIRPMSKDKISLLSPNLFSIQNKNLNEIYDARTNTLSNYKIKLAREQHSVWASVFANGKGLYGYINKNTEEILEPVYTDFTQLKMFDRNFIPAEVIKFNRADGKFDIYNTATGKIVVKDVEKTGPLQGYWLPVMFNGKYKFVDCYGESKFDDLFDNVKSVRTEGYSVVRKGMKYGLIDRDNNTILPYKFADIADVVDDLAITSDGSNYYGLRNLNDSVYIQDQYDELFLATIDQDTSGTTYYFLARKGEKMGVIDHSNKIISPFELDGIVRFPFTAGGFTISKNNKVVLFNGKGKCVIDGNFDNIELFEGMGRDGKEIALVTKGNKTGLYGTDGKLILPVEYDNIVTGDVYYDLNDFIYYELEKGGKKGMWCNNGNITIPVKFDRMTTAYGDDIGFTLVKENGKYGLYKAFRKNIANCVYDAIELNEATAYAAKFTVKYKGKYGLLDSTGKMLIPAEYDKIEAYDSEGDLPQYFIYKGGKIGLAQSNGKIIIPALFDKIEPDYELGETTWYTYKDKRIGLYLADGTEVVPCQFKTKDYYGEDDGKYILVFIAQNGEKWGLSSTFVFEKISQ
ncbi:MAG TPA: WG repeat-containing protein [Flavobacteriales bacterium]|nr:WG repeat-containing protein [Flavobacteriales bacterium]